MSQLELPFEVEKLHFETRVHKQRKQKFVEMSTTLFDGDGFALIVIEYAGRPIQGLSSKQRKWLWWAWNLRLTRPAGDAVFTNEGSIFYLTELVR